MATPDRFNQLTKHYERLLETLKDYSLEDALCAIADKAHDESEQLKALGYQDSAAELERLADILGCLNVPGLPTATRG